MRIARVARVVAITVMAIGCDPTPPGVDPDASRPDAAIDAAADAAVEAAADAEVGVPIDAELDAAPDARAPIDAPVDAVADARPPPDAPPDAPPAGPPVIESVATAAGFTEIRQGGGETLVIRGRDLAGATAVTLGSITATIQTSTASEIRADVAIPHGHPPGPLPLAVTTAAGTATAADAIRITWVVVAADAALGGHGTYQSPFVLCDRAVETAGGGDTVELLAGEHICPQDGDDRIIGVLLYDAHVQGAGQDRTFVRPSLQLGGGQVGAPVHVADVTLVRRPDTDWLRGDIEAYGHTLIERVTMDGGWIWLGDLNPFAFATATVRDVVGSGLVGQGDTTISVSDVELVRGGISVTDRVEIDISRTTFANSGLSAGDRDYLGDWDDGATVAIEDSEFLDSDGLLLADAHVSMRNTVIRHDASAPAELAVDLEDGGFWMEHGEIVGYQSAIRRHSEGDQWASVRLDDVQIDAAGTAISLSGFDAGGLRMRHSRVRAAAGDAVHIAGDAGYDLGTDGEPGDNQLESGGGGYALFDEREDAGLASAHARGTPLNGRVYDGQTLEGPVDHPPDVRIVHFDSTIHF